MVKSINHSILFSIDFTEIMRALGYPRLISVSLYRCCHYVFYFAQLLRKVYSLFSIVVMIVSISSTDGKLSETQF